MQEVSVQQNFADKPSNPLVGIAGTICTFSLVIVMFFAIFAKEQMMASVYIVAVLAFMGICLGHISTRSTSCELTDEA